MPKIKIISGVGSGLVSNFIIFLDGKKLQKMKQNSSIIINVDIGEHQIEFKDSSWFKKSKIYELNVNDDNSKSIFVQHDFSGYKVEIMNDIQSEQKTKTDLIEKTKDLKEILNTLTSEDEFIEVAIKGAFREYLICTNKKVYIIKKGYMTGHLFGDGNFSIPYLGITNVEIDFHFMSGYFEISTGGLENKRLKFWSSDEKNDPAKQPNCISLDCQCKEKFEKAKNFIFDKMSNSDKVSLINNVSIPDQIREYKKLLDDGIISQDDFDKKKKELMSK